MVYGTETAAPLQKGDPEIVPVVIVCANAIFTNNKFMNRVANAITPVFLNSFFIWEKINI